MALTAPFFFSCSTHYPSILWLCGILPVCAAPKCENWLTQKPVTWQNKARYKNNNNHSKSMQTLKHGKIWLHLTKTCWSSLCKKEMNIEHWEYKVWSLDGSLLNPADRWCQTVTMWVMRKEMSSSLFFWQRPVSPYSVQLAVKCFRPLVHHCSPVDVNTRCLGDAVEMIRPRGEQRK